MTLDTLNRYGNIYGESVDRHNTSKMATAQMASSEIDDISHVDFDEELSEGSRQNNTEINFEVNNSQSETQSQIIEDLLKKRQPFLMLWKKLKHQKDNKYNSRCLNINFEPILPNKTETLDNKFKDIVQKYRDDMISELLDSSNSEAAELSATLTTTYNEEVKRLKSN